MNMNHKITPEATLLCKMLPTNVVTKVSFGICGLIHNWYLYKK